MKKLLVDVANLATCCHDDDDVLLEVLGTLRECYVSSRLGLTTFPPTRARAFAENTSARPEDFDPKTGKTQRGRSRFPLTRARVGGNVVRPRRLPT